MSLFLQQTEDNAGKSRGGRRFQLPSSHGQTSQCILHDFSLTVFHVVSSPCSCVQTCTSEASLGMLLKNSPTFSWNHPYSSPWGSAARTPDQPSPREHLCGAWWIDGLWVLFGHTHALAFLALKQESHTCQCVLSVSVWADGSDRAWLTRVEEIWRLDPKIKTYKENCWGWGCIRLAHLFESLSPSVFPVSVSKNTLTTMGSCLPWGWFWIA